MVAQGADNTSINNFWIKTLSDELKLSRMTLLRVGIAAEVDDVRVVGQAALQEAFWRFIDVAKEMKTLIDGLVLAHRATGIPGAVIGFVWRHRNEAWDMHKGTQ